MTSAVATPTRYLNDAARGLAQQMVLWGHDVCHPDGNALVRFGLLRKPSTGLTGTSCYSIPWENGHIELHGAIASWTAPSGKTGCTYCRDRGKIELWSGTRSPVPGREFGEAGTPEARWHAVQPLLRWLVEYETWILKTLGPAWRTNCWRAFKRLPTTKAWLPPDKALHWWTLATTTLPPRPRALT